MNTTSLSFVLAASLLVASGCSALDSDSVNPNARPAGCSQTMCDYEYQQCTSQSTNMCSQCMSDCESDMEASGDTSCLDTCNDICSDPSSDNACSDQQTQCENTSKNAECIDGVDPANFPGSPDLTLSWTPPAPAHAGACSTADITAYVKACGENGTQAKCQAWQKASATCSSCAITQASAPAWGPLFVQSSLTFLNDVGCIASINGDVSATGCGAKIYARDACTSACDSASDVNACTAFIEQYDCKDVTDAANSCISALGLNQSGTPYDVCALDQFSDDAITSVTTFFCGN